eukprot:CAMPEP_0175156026 /NCGR_PEP_ID=MMETSP0087-20121206/21349_1 /TAXON_ID=136419 /ORGANISM="Unknown Unknown, Strain D1" /LENGTH=240 /DNA_ID=CAMNT_0016443341 /DNA_START=63 /DNA_END=785 /DNA_ORIENTATION=+
MLTDVFGRHPELVTPAFCATFVSLLGVFNLGGRIGYSSLSDIAASRAGTAFHGRKLTFAALFGATPPLYLACVWSIHQVAAGADPSLPLTIFCISIFGIFSTFGGTTATRPAFVADTFGTANVGVLTARQLSVVMPASFAGPKLASMLREKGVNQGIRDLTALVDDSVFASTFGASKDELEVMIAGKSISISRLLEVAPPGTADPTLLVYDQALYIMAALQCTAFAGNLLLQPLPAHKHS